MEGSLYTGWHKIHLTLDVYEEKERVKGFLQHSMNRKECEMKRSLSD